MRIISKDVLLADRRKQELIEEAIPYTYNGEMREVIKRIVCGEMEAFELEHPIGEMLTTPDGLDAVVQNTIINLELGREAEPLLYKSIYRTMTDANFSENVDISPFIRAQVVFLLHAELDEVKFGVKKIGPKDTVPINTYAAGFEWTEDMREYDKTWERNELDRAMGEAYNALLNHIHLSPILEYNYANKNKTAASAEGDTLLERMRNTVRAGLQHAGQDKNTDTRMSRKPTVLLAHSSRRMDIEECLQRMQIGGTIYPAISQIGTLVFYDGWSDAIGEKEYSYAGCSTSKAYLIEPLRYFRELIKHDLRVDAQAGDLRRLIEQVVVGRARRGVVASPANAVEEITLPD